MALALTDDEGFELVDAQGLVVDEDCASGCCGDAACCRAGTHTCGTSASGRSLCVTQWGASGRSETRLVSRRDVTVSYRVPALEICNPPRSGQVVHEHIETTTGMVTTRSEELTTPGGGRSLPGFCRVFARFPIVASWETIGTDSGSIFHSDECPVAVVHDYNRPTDHADVYEDCAEARADCWYLSGEAPEDQLNLVFIGAWADWVRLGADEDSDVTTVEAETSGGSPAHGIPGITTVTTTRVQRRRVTAFRWQADREEYSDSITSSLLTRTTISKTWSGTAAITLADGSVVPHFDVAGSSYLEELNDYTYRARGRVKMGWEEDCDGQTPPVACGASRCNPHELPFIVGEPCSGFNAAGGMGVPRPLVLPAANVRGCGRIPGPGNAGRSWCYKFTPGGRKTRDPSALGAVIGTQVIGGAEPVALTCCECLDEATCPKTDLSVNIPGCWVNARRDEITGEFIVEEATVGGKCCCFASDKIRLVDFLLTNEFGPDETGALLGFEECASMATQPYPDDLPNLMAGVRRDFTGQFRYPYSCRFARNQPFNAGQWDIGEGSGIACVWDSQSGFIYDFNTPQSVLNFGLPAPCPRDQRVNERGEYDRNSEFYFRIIRHNVVATCDAFEFSGIREQVRIVDDVVVVRTTVRIRFAIEAAPAVPGMPCVGGCGEGNRDLGLGTGGRGVVVWRGDGGGGCAECDEEGGV